ncbi:Macrolide export ATP-binding/permease protein MacB [Luteitalea pratensis]|uniref:Macrolide export ATP-binding/permease protein MacB n=1 Tax=Luteitalea pratensis TaxID=1855912 RepID=A0A143PG72_LUTPR|nr:ABC transporter permease [Luteitalea pratensis]AMY07582.1 Macrolide export ATP-binding/permease protein MacB [Luteitalea pratensis]
MLLHNIWIAWKSLRRSPTLSVLIVACIALGIAFATTFAAVRHAFTKHPLPDKEQVLRYIRLDNWDPRQAYPGDRPDALPPQISYRDAMALKRSTLPVRQTASFRARLTVIPNPAVARPTREEVRLAEADFFEMFQVPFRHGGAWTREADSKLEQVIVLSETLNERLFGGRNSVGQSLRIENRDFRIVGVLAGWQPTVRMYDMTGSALSEPEAVFMPFGLVVPMEIRTAGNSDGWGTRSGTGVAAFLNSETSWLQFWVELRSPKDDAAYRSFIESYITEQKKVGRYGRPMNYRVSSIKALMEDFNIAPKETFALLMVGLLFLAVAAVNLIGLLLGKFLARANEVGVRRALGASRRDVFLQHLVECQVVAILGGIIGVVLSGLSLRVLNGFMLDMTNRAGLFSLDARMLLLALGLSILAGLISGVYPAWRICRLAPANHLKA